MVHRDIKPQNLMVTPQGAGQGPRLRPGPARRASRAERPTASAARRRTRPTAGMILGTPDYIAPEQADRRPHGRHPGRHLQPRLHALLPADRPAAVPRRDGRREAARCHRPGAAASLRTLRPDVPAELAAVVDEMMAKDPAERYRRRPRWRRPWRRLPGRKRAWSRWPGVGSRRAGTSDWRAGDVEPPSNPRCSRRSIRSPASIWLRRLRCDLS